ncbi:MAG: hypothetical protein ACR2QM_10715 [Longimicrobiales bacterium]
MDWRSMGVVWVLGFSFPLSGAGQEAEPGSVSETINVFADCPRGGCDQDYFRTEMPYVNWMRDRQDADVHILVTPQRTGAGGRLYTLAFIGQGEHAGVESSLERSTAQDATQEEVRQTMAKAISLGLVGYLANSALGDRLTVAYEAPSEGGPTAATPDDDPWNFWVFNLSARGRFNGQSTSKSQNLNGSTSANRTTEDLKVRLGVNVNYNENEFELSTGTLNTIQRNLSFNGLVAWSLGKHWAFGPQAVASSSTFLNQHLNLRFAPTLEYNFFPYSESTRHQLTFSYAAGANYFDYNETTIFGQDEETVFDQTVRTTLDLREQWGSASISLEGATFLDDFDKNRVTLFGNVNVRLIRGLSLDIFGSYSRVRDQIFLERGGATDDEVLLRLRQLGTDFTYFTSVGLRYTFGSIFNNVVNSRMDNISGGGGFFFF